ncbi:unnamed protein product [Protopolystoma xenopodis]|uniref:Uncharacterized protein n=1 Tax=Protopolystoma xenopodis TaxID=117903 RepID=A0A448WVN1_9PLAT|nr:unnamed protein product [Protopolystoma xenopodis]
MAKSSKTPLELIDAISASPMSDFGFPLLLVTDMWAVVDDLRRGILGNLSNPVAIARTTPLLVSHHLKHAAGGQLEPKTLSTDRVNPIYSYSPSPDYVACHVSFRLQTIFSWPLRPFAQQPRIFRTADYALTCASMGRRVRSQFMDV